VIVCHSATQIAIRYSDSPGTNISKAILYGADHNPEQCPREVWIVGFAAMLRAMVTSRSDAGPARFLR